MSIVKVCVCIGFTVISLSARVRKEPLTLQLVERCIYPSFEVSAHSVSRASKL